MNQLEWMARFKARLIENGCSEGVADDVTDNVDYPDAIEGYEEDPEQCADDEISGWDNSR